MSWILKSFDVGDNIPCCQRVTKASGESSACKRLTLYKHTVIF